MAQRVDWTLVRRGKGAVTRRAGVAAIAFALLACAVSAAEGIWETKPLTAWTDVELKELLANSPWAGKASLTHTQAGGTRQPINDTVLATWTSALPMRQALVREAIGTSGTLNAQMEAFLAQPQDAYVIALKVQGMSQMAARVVEPIQKATFLVRDGKQPIPALQAESRTLDKEGRLVEQPAAAAPGRGGRGGFAAPEGSALIVFAFPKASPITLDDKEVELVTRIGQYNVKKKFKLKDMVVKGELAL